MRTRRMFVLLAVVAVGMVVPGGLRVARGQEMTTLSATLARTQGVDAATKTEYTRLFLVGQPGGGPRDSRVGGASGSQMGNADEGFDGTRPALMVDCTRRADGRYGFALGLNFDGVADGGFHPMRSRGEGTPRFDRRSDQRDVLFEFFGYTKVKPFSRQFFLVSEPTGALAYNPPGLHSFNMEEAAYHLQYLRALPTFRMTFEGRSATFATEPLLAQIRREPLCGASHL